MVFSTQQTYTKNTIPLYSNLKGKLIKATKNNSVLRDDKTYFFSPVVEGTQVALPVPLSIKASPGRKGFTEKPHTAQNL